MSFVLWNRLYFKLMQLLVCSSEFSVNSSPTLRADWMRVPVSGARRWWDHVRVHASESRLAG